MEELKSTYPLIHNKVTSPRYVTPTLRRARLIDWLSANAECRAVVLAADAGYGKTTLLWQWEREVDFPCYWYKLDRNDRDWTLHISYLVEAISQHYPGFGRRAHSVLRQMGGPGSSRAGVAAYLLAESHERRALIESLTAKSDSDLFAFLAEEVLDQQPEETRNFLLSTSILHQITPEVAERLAGVHDGTRRLMQLEHTGLFTYRLDESRFR